MPTALSPNEQAQLLQTIEMFEVISQSQPQDHQSLEILKEAYFKLGRHQEVVHASKRIAQAYVQEGQLSSAILEYESILQLFPNDPDVQAALAEIENRANSFGIQSAASNSEEYEKPRPAAPTTTSPNGRVLVPEIDDGRQTMYKMFVDGKVVSAADFNACWFTPDLTATPSQVIEPFVQILADKEVLTVEQSMKMIVEKSRLTYLPLERYDVDIDTARSFPRELCQRWCVMPFDRLSKSVLVATTNPFNKQAAHDLEQITKNRLLWYLSMPAELTRTVRKVFR